MAQTTLTLAETPETGTETLVDLLRRAALEHPERGVYSVDSRGDSVLLTYRDLWSAAIEAAGSMSAHGVRPGDKVALLLPNGAEFPPAFFGALLAGAVPVPLPPRSPFGRVEALVRRTEHALNDCRPKMLVCQQGDREDLSRVGAVGEIVEWSEVQRSSCKGERRSPAASMHRPDPDEAALIQYTSGSTTDPRGVVLSHRNLCANIRSIVDLLRWTENDSGTMWLPLYHDMGLIGGLLVPLSQGGDLHLLRPEDFLMDPGLWLRTISRFRTTISACPNFGYAYATRRVSDEAVASLDLRSWRVALNGGESIDQGVIESFWNKFGGAGLSRSTMLPCYGLAEATLAVTGADPTHTPRALDVDARALARDGHARPPTSGGAPGKRLVSCGRPVFGSEVRIRRGTRVLREGRVGEIEVRGSSVTPGYLDQPAATAEAFDGMWLRTGDLGFLSDGELFVTGRSKDLIIARGQNYYPEDLEAAAESVEGVRKGSAVAVAEADSEALVVLVETRVEDGKQLRAMAVEIRRRVAEDSGIQPSEVVVCRALSLPKTSSGKRQRRLSLRLYRKGELEPSLVLSPRHSPGRKADADRSAPLAGEVS